MYFRFSSFVIAVCMTSSVYSRHADHKDLEREIDIQEVICRECENKCIYATGCTDWDCSKIIEFDNCNCANCKRTAPQK